MWEKILRHSGKNTPCDVLNQAIVDLLAEEIKQSGDGYRAFLA